MTDNAKFDRYAEDYQKLLGEQLGFFDPDKGYFAEYKIDIIKKHITGTPKKILEYGCGIGRNLPYLTRHFEHSTIYACDISSKSLDIAKAGNPKVKFFLLGQDLIQGKFDLIIVALVFHHIYPSFRSTVMSDIFHLLQEQGNIFIFEHNPYNPVTRYLVNHCIFDDDAVLITKREMMKILTDAHLAITAWRYTLFFPAFLKKLRFFEPVLGYLPLGGQYFIKARKSK